ncbi:hypothetical protein E4U30_003342 [Claviceps sp. LM220 group G6]|nr:hypothetical protein E4U30_003342 [Claviceps sp. LM220 group G6]
MLHWDAQRPTIHELESQESKPSPLLFAVLGQADRDLYESRRPQTYQACNLNAKFERSMG